LKRTGILPSHIVFRCDGATEMHVLLRGLH
jgi:hypothetical protein